MRAKFIGNPRGAWIRHMGITRGGVYSIQLRHTNWFSKYILLWPLLVIIRVAGKRHACPYGSMQAFENSWSVK